ncbi:hypothetical protein [Myroides guanonis]|uniref:Uncharacterized protein n=1 Tax=Myroides guanonis TaxID=1150112 RepID=A0A1I3SHC4_9FLAO|nr:hypothetical protein [Myroides guanonis]SFJ57041.1 hypothetical protein SAMN04487893_11057 [Myroides guanonis]
MNDLQLLNDVLYVCVRLYLVLLMSVFVNGIGCTGLSPTLWLVCILVASIFMFLLMN